MIWRSRTDTCGCTFESSSRRQMFSIRTAAFILGLGGCIFVGGCQRSDDSSAVANRRQTELPTVGTADTKTVDRSSGTHRVSGSPVSASLTLEPVRAKRGDEVVLTVKLKIEPLWEVSALGEHPTAPATQLELELPDSVSMESDWQAPKTSRSIAPDGHPVYVDEALFIRKLRVKSDSPAGNLPVKCRLHFQACNDQQCLAPAEVELGVNFEVE
jgi:hypothetical protein